MFSGCCFVSRQLSGCNFVKKGHGQKFCTRFAHNYLTSHPPIGGSGSAPAQYSTVSHIHSLRTTAGAGVERTDTSPEMELNLIIFTQACTKNIMLQMRESVCVCVRACVQGRRQGGSPLPRNPPWPQKLMLVYVDQQWLQMRSYSVIFFVHQQLHCFSIVFFEDLSEDCR